MKCPECKLHVPLARFRAAEWMAVTPLYADECDMCQEALRADAAHELAQYFAELVAVGALKDVA